MEEEPLDSRSRNITLAIVAAIALAIGGLVFHHYRVRHDRIAGMKSLDRLLQASKVREMMQGAANDGFVAEQVQGERPSVRMAAVRALRSLTLDPNAPPELRRKAAAMTVPFLKDSDQPIRDLAIQSLTAMGPEIAMEAATGALGDTDTNVKAGAQKVCEGFAPHSIAPLLAFRDGGAKARLRTAHRVYAGNALYEISKKDPRWKTVILFGEEAVRARERGLSPRQAREELRRFLGLDRDLLIGPEERVYGLVDYLGPANANEDDQNNVISVLDRIGDTRAVPFLLPRLDRPTTRRAAVGALGRLADRRATARLVHYLPIDEINRLEIVVALGRIADPAATEALIRHGLGSLSGAVRAAAVDSLRNIGAPALPRLIAAATSRDPTDPACYRAAGATRALAGLRLPEATRVAIRNLKHPADAVREAAAASLGDSGDPAVIAPLIESFEDRDGRVGGLAARSLSLLGARAVPALVEALDNPRRVYWASLAIRYIGPPAVPALMERVRRYARRTGRGESLSEGERGAARAAAALLGDLGDTRAIAALQEALAAKPDPDFTFAASSSLQRLAGGRAPAGPEAS